MGQRTDFSFNSEFPSAWQLKLRLLVMDVPSLVLQLHPLFTQSESEPLAKKTEWIYAVGMTLSCLVLGALIEGAG